MGNYWDQLHKIRAQHRLDIDNNEVSLMGKYFVTGGAGFIGSHLVDRLIGSGNVPQVRFNITKMKNMGWKQLSLWWAAPLCLCEPPFLVIASEAKQSHPEEEAWQPDTV